MKRSKNLISDMEARFGKAKMDRNKMNYLLGGDENGGQGGTDDPWYPGG